MLKIFIRHMSEHVPYEVDFFWTKNDKKYTFYSILPSGHSGARTLITKNLSSFFTEKIH